MDNFSKFLGYFVLFVVAIAGSAVLAAFPVMWMWNAVVPELFGLKAIGFFQALILSALCSTLFKSSPSSSKS